MASSPSPQLILGSAGFGVTWQKETLPELRAALENHKDLISRIDTAALYSPVAPVCETGFSETFKIDTKIAFDMQTGANHTLDVVEGSVGQSLESLKCNKINVLYCHGPDKVTPISEQAAALDELHKRGHFTSLGVCNFSKEMLTEWLSVAADKGYIKPSVYQGQYNLLCRGYETDIFPLLREHNIAFVGYSPLAGGFLTGKLTFATSDTQLEGTRFEKKEGNVMGAFFRYRYDSPSMNEAVKKLKGLCEEYEDVEMADAAFRWVMFHSEMKGHEEDGVLIGPSTVKQLEKYMNALRKGPLKEEMANKMSALFEHVKEDAAKILMY